MAQRNPATAVFPLSSVIVKNGELMINIDIKRTITH